MENGPAAASQNKQHLRVEATVVSRSEGSI
jgi:hypothetical protein